jgi:hypothetical protein
MPNPFIKAGALRTSQEASDRPRPIEPVPESYEGVNNPYRGTESHGVEATEKPLVPEDWRDGRPVEYKEPEPAPTPVPVIIVSESGRELRRFRTFGAFTGTTGNPPASVIGRDEERNTVTVKHRVDGAVVWISHSSETCKPSEGWPLETGDTYTTQAHGPIYAWADLATPLALHVVVEYASGV